MISTITIVDHHADLPAFQMDDALGVLGDDRVGDQGAGDRHPLLLAAISVPVPLAMRDMLPWRATAVCRTGCAAAAACV